jgi:hypothetical protein
MLDVHNVQYTEVKDNKELALAKEIIEYPAIEVDGKIIDEYANVLSWLRQNNYYSLWGDKDESN